MTLPIVELSGSPYQQGVRHGTALRDRIAHNVRVYFDRFEREGRLRRYEVLSRTRRYLGHLGSDPYEQGVRGVAAGSRFDLLEILAVNVRYEILYQQLGIQAPERRRRGAKECTSFVVQPAASANGHLLLGENWDWVPGVQSALLRTRERDGRETLSLTEAGIFGGKIGLSSAGLGLVINGLVTTADDWSRHAKPFHVRCYEIMRSPDLESAVRVVLDGARAGSANFLIAQAPERAIDVEAAPAGASLLEPKDGVFVHTNHFLDGAALGVVEPLTESWYSVPRLDRMSALLRSRAPLGVADLQAALRDHQDYPNGVCCHPDPAEPPQEQGCTLASVVMDLSDRVLWATDGPPCQNPYAMVRLATAGAALAV